MWDGRVFQAGIPHIRFHDLRHTAATRLVLAGVDLPTVKEILGHASIKVTEKYTHPTPEHKRAAMDRLGNFQGGTLVGRDEELGQVVDGSKLFGGK